MLKSWSIENFKPIVNSGELKLAPVTVLAGRNSSGKSSLLQSILMIAQTLSNRLPDRTLLPNERIVQLGTFEDILNISSGLRSMCIGFVLDFEKQSSSKSRSNIKTCSIKIGFSSPEGNSSKISSALDALKVNVDNVSLQVFSEFKPLQQSLFDFPEKTGAKEVLLQLEISVITKADLNLFLNNVAPDYLRLVPNIDEQSSFLGQFKLHDEEKIILGPCLVSLSHFLPIRFFHKFKIEERRKQALKRAIRYLFEYPGDSLHLPHLLNNLTTDAPISENLKASINQVCEENKISQNFSGQSLYDLVNWFKAPMVGIRGGKKRSLGSKIQEILLNDLIQSPLEIETGYNKDSEGLEAYTNNVYIENFEQSVDQITRFFTSQIRYLGPLRADPQASQKFAPSSELDDVGAKGEYAAAVYDANQNAIIKWYNPFSTQVELNNLKTALDRWVQYLGVANQIKIETLGHSGFSWRVVSKKGQIALPLSAVGVGVSQILPILVMGLLSPSNILLIVEQPELHLHPSVQARLGDFFVGLSKCKKQCLIETHSENLVSQLRYHIVQAGSMENSDCMIYFVDQDEKGAAKFEPVEISPQGNILNWPDGFFDETMLQEDRITAASIKKRAAKVKNA